VVSSKLQLFLFTNEQDSGACVLGDKKQILFRDKKEFIPVAS